MEFSIDELGHMAWKDMIADDRKSEARGRTLGCTLSTTHPRIRSTSCLCHDQ